MNNILKNNLFKYLVFFTVCFKIFNYYQKNNVKNLVLFLIMILLSNKLGNSNRSIYFFVAILISDCILKNETKEYFSWFSGVTNFLSDPIKSTGKAINKGKNILFTAKDTGVNLFKGNFSAAALNAVDLGTNVVDFAQNYTLPGIAIDQNTKLADKLTNNYFNLNAMTAANIKKSYLADLGVLAKSENECQFCYNFVKNLIKETISSKRNPGSSVTGAVCAPIKTSVTTKCAYSLTKKGMTKLLPMCPGIAFVAYKLCMDAVNDKINENQLIEKIACQVCSNFTVDQLSCTDCSNLETDTLNNPDSALCNSSTENNPCKNNLELSQTKSCDSSSACENEAKKLGYKIGGKGYAFAGEYGTSGCYAYKKNANSKYKGIAYYGTKNGNKTDSLKDPKVRIKC